MERHLLIWACKKCFWISKKSRIHYALEYFAHAHTCMLKRTQGTIKRKEKLRQAHYRIIAESGIEGRKTREYLTNIFSRSDLYRNLNGLPWKKKIINWRGQTESFTSSHYFSDFLTRDVATRVSERKWVQSTELDIVNCHFAIYVRWHLRDTVLMSSKKDETAIHCCNPALLVPVMLVFFM